MQPTLTEPTGRAVRNEPLVSVVTPFYNSASFLRDCIESVLRQTYTQWEYILVNNNSSDKSVDIVQQYVNACPDRIKLYHTPTFLTQVQNYNFALTLLSPTSKYCKIVQADDWLDDCCLQRMVSLAESDCSIALVSSYWMDGNRIGGCGLDPAEKVLDGREICRRQLKGELFCFGSPTTVMYRSADVRAATPFYDERCVHEDTDTCYRLLISSNFGFVHQITSFWRRRGDSILGKVEDCGWQSLDQYLQVLRYAAVYFDHKECGRLLKTATRTYYCRVAKELLSTATPSRVWRYQRDGMLKEGHRFSYLHLLACLLLELFVAVLSPGYVARRLAMRFLAFR